VHKFCASCYVRPCVNNNVLPYLAYTNMSCRLTSCYVKMAVGEFWSQTNASLLCVLAIRCIHFCLGSIQGGIRCRIFAYLEAKRRKVEIQDVVVEVQSSKIRVKSRLSTSSSCHVVLR
jgi:hypothetical protein